MNKKENLNLYACLLRKFYVGEEDYMNVTLKGITKLQKGSSWSYALSKIKEDSRIKNPTTISIKLLNKISKRYMEFNNNDEIVRYLFSSYNSSDFNLSDDLFERRLKYLLAIKTLKFLEKEINNENLELEYDRKLTFEVQKQLQNLKNENDKKVSEEIKKNQELKKISSITIKLAVFTSLVIGYFTFNYINTLKNTNESILNNAELTESKLLEDIDNLNNEIYTIKDENYRLNNLLENEEYLSGLVNEKKFKSLKQEKYSGNISFENVFGFKSINGQLINGEERGLWVYEKFNGEKEKYKWISSRVGAICRDGNRSYATGRGACSHHGGVNYWLNEYQRVRIQN